MTLIVNLGVGGLLTAVTSDTRQVMSLKMGGFNKSWRIEDAENKAVRLTDTVLFAGGGANRLVDRVKAELAERVTENDDLSACHVKFSKVIDDQVNHSDEFQYMIEDDEYFAQIFLTGFNHDGTSGHSSYMMEAGALPEYKVYPELAFDGLAVAPSDDHMQVIAEYMGQFRPQQETLINDTVGMLAGIQKTLFQTNSEEVSETCNYVVLFRDPQTGQVHEFNGSLNLG
jgi:hypothetical protein